ncbi:helix-turn-helix domain-containing protein [Chrysiogenes arsenatis]|uniref:helix-turn-helix domain-containing protein n=1 Tax=Chrysiogenes arsenatis TaxID=309797 RepID=UPI000406FE6C|nr:helix-turn-helix transcriptional regulator [Chrysiogenes arsenatis]
MNISEIIGRKIRIIRKSKRLSSEKLGLAVGIEGSYIRQIETGKRKLNILILERLADALNVNLAALFDPQLPIEKKELPVEERLDLAIVPVFEGFSPQPEAYTSPNAAIDFFPVPQLMTQGIEKPAESCFWVRINSEDFQPLLRRGDLVLLNRRVNFPLLDGVPALTYHNGAPFLGRVTNAGGLSLLISTNLDGKSVSLPVTSEEGEGCYCFEVVWKANKFI